MRICAAHMILTWQIHCTSSRCYTGLTHIFLAKLSKFCIFLYIQINLKYVNNQLQSIYIVVYYYQFQVFILYVHIQLPVMMTVHISCEVQRKLLDTYLYSEQEIFLIKHYTQARLNSIYYRIIYSFVVP